MLKYLGNTFALYYACFCSACKECKTIYFLWKHENNKKMPVMLNVFLLCKAWIKLFWHGFKNFWMLWNFCPIQYASLFFMYWKTCILLTQLICWKRNQFHWFDRLLHVLEMFPQHCIVFSKIPFHELHILITCIVTAECEEKLCMKIPLRRTWSEKERF